MDDVTPKNTPVLFFKCIIIGDSAVGKSTLLQQFTTHEFIQNTKPTIQVELGTKTIQVRDKRVKLEIWDTAGMENFRALTRSYYRNSDGCLVVFDVNSRRSFENIFKWIEEAKEYSYNRNIVMMLVGNKVDVNRREVEKEEAELFAEENGLLYAEATATQLEATQKLFLTTADQIYAKMLGEPSKMTPRPKQIQLKSMKSKVPTDEEGCC